jgi:ribosomal protein S18 acetylase RimI-like enzyme
MDQAAAPALPTIRPLTRGDAAQWRALRLQALQAHPTAFAESHAEAAERDLAAYAARMPAAGDAAAIFGLFLGEGLHGSAGFAVLAGEQRRHKGLLWGVYVSSELRGKGLARRLIERVIARARDHVALLQAVVSADNAPARRLYAELGFRRYGLEPAGLRVDGAFIDEELIWLDLRGGDSLPPGDLSDRRAP